MHPKHHEWWNKSEPPRGCALALTLATLAMFALALLGGEASAAPRVRAVRTARAPEIDGRLDDPVWRDATLIKDFVQRSPTEGAAPRQRTEVRLIYDEGAIYVALRMWDSEPGRIRGGFGRRDNPPDSDWVTVIIDPLLTRKRGYFFRVNASGVIADGLVFQEINMDTSWDAVWTAAAQVDGQGWTAEMKIPLTSIAFQDQPSQRWGLHVERYLQRDKALSTWPSMPKTSNTFVSRFGVLEGLEGLRRETALRLLPYAAAEIQLGRRADALRPDDPFRPNGGLDLSYGLSGDLALHASINPDFGQVEDDPAVVNLTPNEVFFGERRPFFVAGADLFQSGLLTLLHTRRIGARPAAPDPDHEEGEIVEVDPEARIIGAGKLMGESGNASYGLLTALVLPAHATERLPDGALVERRATRGTHYGAGRLKLRLGRTSQIGLLATAMTRINEEQDTDAYAGGVDWDLRTSTGWQTTGQVTGAAAQEGAGYGLKIQAGQMGAPRWRYWVDAESFSAHYQINDVGYQWRNDMVRLKGALERRLASPWRFLRDGGVGVWTQHGFNHTDPSLVFERRLELWTWFKFNNLWGLWTGAGQLWPALDDRETRGGPPYPRPAETFCWLGGETDTSARVVFWSTAVFVAAAGQAFWVDGNLQANLLSRLNLQLYARWRMDRGATRWIETLERPSRDVYLFGDMDREELELKLSALLGLHRLVTLQVFSQLLFSVGRYDSLRALQTLADGSTALGPTAEQTDGDFATTRLIVNAILRWDLGAGTAAYLVYKLDGALDEEGAPVTSFDPVGALGRLGREEQTHLLLLKLSYGFEL